MESCAPAPDFMGEWLLLIGLAFMPLVAFELFKLIRQRMNPESSSQP